MWSSVPSVVYLPADESVLGFLDAGVSGANRVYRVRDHHSATASVVGPSETSSRPACYTQRRSGDAYLDNAQLHDGPAANSEYWPDGSLSKYCATDNSMRNSSGRSARSLGDHVIGREGRI